MTAQQQAPARRHPVLTVLVALPVLALFALGGLTVAHTVMTSTTTEHATYPAGITTLDIRTDGEIIIQSTGDDAVRLERRISFNLQQPVVRETVDGDTLRITADCQDGISFSLSLQPCSVDYILQVPAEISVTAHSENGGVDVRDLTGTLDLSSTNGDVHADNVDGTLRMTAENGEVMATGLRAAEVAARSRNGEVVLAFAEAPTTVTAWSTNASVTLAVPTSRRYHVEARSSIRLPAVAVPTAEDSPYRLTATALDGTVFIHPAD